MTTKTGRLIAEAFRDGKLLGIKHTVTHAVGSPIGGGYGHVWLYGRVIAYYDREGVVWMSLSRHPTRTTRDRLNAILEAFGSPNRFWQHDWLQYYGDDRGPYYGRNASAVEIGSTE